MNKLTAFNELFASKSTVIFSSMWAFYAFVAYGLLPVFFPSYQNDLLYWSNCVQLVALPLLAVGQRVLSTKHDDLHDKVDSLMPADTPEEATDAGHGN